MPASCSWPPQTFSAPGATPCSGGPPRIIRRASLVGPRPWRDERHWRGTARKSRRGWRPAAVDDLTRRLAKFYVRVSRGRPSVETASTSAPWPRPPGPIGVTRSYGPSAPRTEVSRTPPIDHRGRHERP
jgi:hypothetical protein